MKSISKTYTHLSSPIHKELKSQQNILDLLLHAINGRQLSILKAEDERQYTESVGSFKKVTETVKGNLKHMLTSWCCVENLPCPEYGTTANLVHGLSLEWGVRVIGDLFMELEVQREGLPKYQAYKV